MAISMPQRGSVSLDENTAEYLSTIMDQRKTIDALMAALERVVRVRDWRHDEDSSARRDYELAADECDAALALARGGK